MGFRAETAGPHQKGHHYSGCIFRADRRLNNYLVVVIVSRWSWMWKMEKYMESFWCWAGKSALKLTWPWRPSSNYQDFLHLPSVSLVKAVRLRSVAAKWIPFWKPSEAEDQDEQGECIRYISPFSAFVVQPAEKNQLESKEKEDKAWNLINFLNFPVISDSLFLFMKENCISVKDLWM